jgi:putative FmdB family regulatory protein
VRTAGHHLRSFFINGEHPAVSPRRHSPVPRYDYRCEAGHRYEKQEPFGSPSEHPCEKCGKTAQRQISAPTVVFKGGGWYKTDSRDAAGGRSRSKTPAGESSNGAKAEEKAKAKDASDAIDRKAEKASKSAKADKTAAD